PLTKVDATIPLPLPNLFIIHLSLSPSLSFSLPPPLFLPLTCAFFWAEAFLTGLWLIATGWRGSENKMHSNAGENPKPHTHTHTHTHTHIHTQMLIHTHSQTHTYTCSHTLPHRSEEHTSALQPHLNTL